MRSLAALRIALVALTILLNPAPFVVAGPRPGGLSQEDLANLAKAGLTPALLREQVEKLGLAFEPTPRTLLVLKQAGLDNQTIATIVHEGGLSGSVGTPRETVRMFEQVGNDGRRFLVLTNLDEEGNPIRDPDREVQPAPAPAASELEGTRQPSPEPAPAAPTPSGAPLVVVNVQPPLPPPLLSAPPAWTGSIVGAYQYPERLGFLGYGPGISSPGWFSGLGLNPGNNYGHRKEDKPNTTGFSAFFGPPSH